MTGTGPAAAVAALSAALGADPGRGDLWSELATALVAAGRAREAWDAAARAVELAPQSAASHRAIGTVAAALGDPRQAESAYRHALLLDPADHTTRTALARLPAAPAPAALAPAAASAPTGRRRAPDSDDAVPTTGRRRAPDPDDAAPGPASAPTGRRRAPDFDGAVPAPGRRRAPDSDDVRGIPTGRRAPDDAVSTGGRRRAPDPEDVVAGGGRRRAAEGDPPAWAAPPGSGGRRRAAEVADDVPVPRANGSRHAAPAGDDEVTTGRHGSEQPAGGRRRAREAERGTVVGLPTWLGPSGPGRYDPTAPPPAGAATGLGPPGPVGWPSGVQPAGTTADLPESAAWPVAEPGPAEWRGSVPVGATRVADPDGWRRGLITVVRVEWLVGIACFVGLAYGRLAPYTAGLLAGALVVAGAYGRMRWQGARTRRPPDPDRVPTYAASAAVVTAVAVVPAAMAGALGVARFATVAAVTCATAAAVLIGRTAR